MRPYLLHEHPLRLAHRGSRVLWPENTMAAFRGAVDFGYRYLETDVHVTADGTIVLFHDDQLDRLTNGTGQVAEWRWADLQHLDAAYYFNAGGGYPERGKGHRVPRLVDALEAFPDAAFNLDLKQPGIEETVARFAADHGAEERILVASFHGGRIRRFRQASAGRVATAAGPAEVARVWAASRLGRRVSIAADALQVPVRPGAGPVDARFVRTAHRSGLQVHVWTVNDPEVMSHLLAIGVDGIVTDRPDILDEVLDRRGRSASS